jgi:hypothetical protein
MLDLPVGELVDNLFVRLPARDIESCYEDNYYYFPVECYCSRDEGAGYTFSDEYGDCDFCMKLARQMNGHNDDIGETEIRSKVQSYLLDLQSGNLGIPTIDQLQNAGQLHAILEVL